MNVSSQSANAPAMEVADTVVMNYEPVFGKIQGRSAYRITMFCAGLSPSACLAELHAISEILGNINQVFLIRFAGLGQFENHKITSLPPNIGIIGDQANSHVTLLYDRQQYSVGWDMIAKSAVTVTRDLPPTEITVIQLLGLLNKCVDLNVVTSVIKRDPALQYNLMRYLNSASISIRAHGGFRSFEQAVVLLGYNRLSRWLSMYLLRSNIVSAAPELYRAAITRGRQMELLAGSCGIPESEGDSVFITGALSLVDRLLGVQMEAVLAPLEADITLDNALSEALLKEEGRYASLLGFARACEHGTEYELFEWVKRLGISGREANLSIARGICYAAGLEQP